MKNRVLNYKFFQTVLVKAKNENECSFLHLFYQGIPVLEVFIGDIKGCCYGNEYLTMHPLKRKKYFFNEVYKEIVDVLLDQSTEFINNYSQKKSLSRKELLLILSDY